MKLEPSRKKMHGTGDHWPLSHSIGFALCLMMMLSMLLHGCGTDNSGASLSQGDNKTSSASKNSDSEESLSKDNGLPDLYANLKNTPLTYNENPVHLDGHTSFLPYPSDVFAYRDPSSPSGVRLRIKNDQFPPEIQEILKKIPESLQMDALFKEPDGADLDGFSISTNVLFEFDREVDPAWVGDVDENMARDGGDTFYLMDLTTGEFIPALANESHFAKDPHRTTRDYVMQVMARKRFEHGRRYMAFVTKNFKDKNGNDFSCASGFLKAKSNDGSAISEFYEPWLKYLESEKGIARDDLLAATIFTTRSRKSSIGPIVDMYKTVLQDEFTGDHVRIHNDMYFPYFNLERIVYGRINMRDFRNEEGIIHYTKGFKGTRDKEESAWVPFLLFVPNHAFPKPYPVDIAGSGIVMSKEMMIIPAIANASLGVATLSIDWPSHWERDWAEGWSVLEGIGFVPGGIKENAADMPRLLSMFVQIPIDIMSTYRVLKTYFATSDQAKIWNLDTNNLSYSGYSLGVLSGMSAAACMPDLKGAFMSVGSVNFCKLLSSGRFLLGGPSMAMPEGLEGAWYAAAMTAILSQKSDMFDGLQLADGFRKGVPEMGAGPRPLVATYARNDGWVTAECGVSLREIAELPIIYSQPDIAPYDWNGFIDNLIGKGLENTLAHYNNYGAAEVTLFNNDFKMNETLEDLGIPQALYRLTGHDWYDMSGTLEHAVNAFNGTTFYYLMNLINNIQCDGNSSELSAATKDFGEFMAK